MEIDLKLYEEGYVLKENEYMLKVRDAWSNAVKDSARYYPSGFMTKMNQNGSFPVGFKKWGDVFDYKLNRKDELPTYVIEEDFRMGWKIVGARFGESQNWAIMLHPNGFTIEIYMNGFIDLLKEQTCALGFLVGNYKFDASRKILIKQ